MKAAIRVPIPGNRMLTMNRINPVVESSTFGTFDIKPSSPMFSCVDKLVLFVCVVMQMKFNCCNLYSPSTLQYNVVNWQFLQVRSVQIMAR
jgi:hypothetical protein